MISIDLHDESQAGANPEFSCLTEAKKKSENNHTENNTNGMDKSGMETNQSCEELDAVVYQTADIRGASKEVSEPSCAEAAKTDKIAKVRPISILERFGLIDGKKRSKGQLKGKIAPKAKMKESVNGNKIKYVEKSKQPKKMIKNRELEEKRDTIKAIYQLVRRFDKKDIDSNKECWYLIDSTWLQSWAMYISGKSDEEPGIITNHKLHRPSAVNSTFSDDTLRLGLKPTVDYRAVTPVVWYSYVTLYGKDSTPEICRYVVDIYSPPVSITKHADISLSASMRARSEIAGLRARIKEKYHPEPLHEDEEDEEEEFDEDGLPVPKRLCCLRRERWECLLFWGFTFANLVTTSSYSRLDNPYDRLAHTEDANIDASKDNPHILNNISADEDENEDDDERAILLGP